MRILSDLAVEEQARENVTTMIRENALVFLVPIAGGLIWASIKALTGGSFLSLFKEHEELDPKNFD
jgi:hypothetical protein